MNKILCLIGFLVLWCMTGWVAYWSGFSKSQVICQYVHHLDDVGSLKEKQRLLKSINSGDILGARKALDEQIVTDSKLLSLSYGSQKNATNWLEELRSLIYPRESLILINVYKNSKRNNP